MSNNNLRQYEHIILRQQSEVPVTYEDPVVMSIPVIENNDELVDINQMRSEYVKMLPRSASAFPSDMDHSVNLGHSSFIRKELFKRLEGAVANLRIILNRPKLVFMVVEGLRKRDETDVAHPHKATGGCVSFRIADDEVDEFVDMGDCEVLTFSRNLTQSQIQNRTALLTACGIAGLVNCPNEWWTFCFGTRYFSYYTNNKTAVYGDI